MQKYSRGTVQLHREWPSAGAASVLPCVFSRGLWLALIYAATLVLFSICQNLGLGSLVLVLRAVTEKDCLLILCRHLLDLSGSGGFVGPFLA